MLRSILSKRRHQILIEESDTEEEEVIIGKSQRRHRGPYFQSIDKEMTKDEILTLYRRVPEQYRNGVFWNNFSKECIGRGWIKRVGEAKPLLEKYKPQVTFSVPPPPDINDYKQCIIDGQGFEPITNWRMEPPVVFIGRGDHPLRGSLKRRVIPEDVTLNLDPEAPVPKLPRGRTWGGVVWQPDSGWLWSWVDPLLRKIKYVYPASVSNSHAEREKAKFDNAMELKNHIDKIRKFYNQSFKTGEYLELSCILYLIDNLGLRIGNENNANVDGATTLRVENIKPMSDKNLVRINFIGKDSIEYDNQLLCSEGFINAIRQLSSGKSPSEFLFPHVNPKIVNQYLQSFHPCLTAKTFRTYNATQRFKDAIYRDRGRGGNPSQPDPLTWFKKCATEVAVFCNHKKISTLKKVKEQYSPTTSITNYIDPRVVIEWANEVGIPVRKLYSKTLLERFSWAIQKEEDESAE